MGLITFRVIIKIDASLLGWGAVCEDRITNGHWAETELETVWLALRHFADHIQ